MIVSKLQGNVRF